MHMAFLLTSFLAMFALCVPDASAAGGAERAGRPRLVLATTTSTENSGLLEVLLPPFEERQGVVVDVIAAGTGQALQIGRAGDADVLMVHAPRLEEEFVELGYGVERVPFMWNDFVVLGPPDDPAGVAHATGVADAFTRIARARTSFVSRGDRSGTHERELEIWTRSGAGTDGDWYREVGQGMGAVITLANERRAYTLADRGTFLSYRRDVDLALLYEGDALLMNEYSIIVVDPRRHPHVLAEPAQALVEYLISPQGRELISGYQVEGEQLFFPIAE